MTYLIATALIEAGQPGAIVNVGSRGANRGEPDFPAYGAAKAGLHAFGQSMAIVLAPHQISVATVAPGFIETERQSST
ncbi:SDR family NAD(P)-dependent oxidoreductase, partial [Burkholderia sp. SIMBA_024]|uniref:SDR family NAD(P)-dependent oxidoreductase n=1 Tax=Burkholderia sp. SIMBA_024 TaxID=3085768 RepID=UPI00397D3B03